MPRLDKISIAFVVPATFAIATAMLVAALVAGVWAASEVNGAALAKQRQFIATGLSSAYRKIPLDQESVTIWDDTVVGAGNHDVGWLAANVGEWMFSYFGHNAAYVLDGRGDPLYAMENGRSVAAAAYLPHAVQVAPLLQRLAVDVERSGDAGIGTLGAEDYVDWDGTPAIVSVKPIVPDTKNFRQPSDDRYYHVAVRKIDAAFLKDIASEYAINGLRLIAPAISPPKVAVAVRSSTGTLLGALTWQPYHPGTDIFNQAAPTMFLLVGVGIVLLGLLLGMMLRATRDLEASEEQARYLATHDILTGLPNRAMLDTRMEEFRARQQKDRLSFALLLLDIDHFKRVNDTQGHPAGDELVRTISRRLTGVVSSLDTVARFGGDEFGLLIDGGGHPSARYAEVANRIAAAMREPFDLFGESIAVSVSIGIATSADAAIAKDELLRRADIALYDAKSKGGGGYRFFADSMDELVRYRRRIEHDLGQALLRKDELWIAYQPIFATDGKTVLGAEALVRWHHPVLGELLPDAFIEIAEERGLIGRLSDFVIDEVCELLRASDFPWVAVNISARQFQRDDFADRLLGRLARHGVSPQRLQVEITEGTLIDEDLEVSRVLTGLRDAGLIITLDDFGTGFSSMSYLRQYPVDKIKIDRSFVQQLGATRESDAIVQAILAMARAMGKRVVAEGVETPAQYDCLAKLGCQELQGFLFSKPVPAVALLARRLSEVGTAMRSTLSRVDAPRRSQG